MITDRMHMLAMARQYWRRAELARNAEARAGYALLAIQQLELLSTLSGAAPPSTAGNVLPFRRR